MKKTKAEIKYQLWLGKRIKKIRRDANLTLREFAYLTGLSIGHLSAVENGQNNPTILVLKRITKMLDMLLLDILED